LEYPGFEADDVIGTPARLLWGDQRRGAGRGDALTEGAPQSDDITALAIRRVGDPSM